MKIIRVQGAEFKAIKPNLKMLAYTVTLKGHICAYMEHKETGEIYSHYLNNQEATKFKLKANKYPDITDDFKTYLNTYVKLKESNNELFKDINNIRNRVQDNVYKLYSGNPHDVEKEYNIVTLAIKLGALYKQDRDLYVSQNYYEYVNYIKWIELEKEIQDCEKELEQYLNGNHD